MTTDRLLGLAAVAAAAVMAAAAWNYAAPIAYEPVGPRAFPLLLAAVMAACGAWLAVRPSFSAEFLHLRQIAGCAGAILAYAVLFQLLGFIVATALMCIPVGLIFGGTLRQCLLTGIGMGVLLYLLFDKLLDVVLPLGVLNPLLGR